MEEQIALSAIVFLDHYFLSSPKSNFYPKSVLIEPKKKPQPSSPSLISSISYHHHHHSIFVFVGASVHISYTSFIISPVCMSMNTHANKIHKHCLENLSVFWKFNIPVRKKSRCSYSQNQHGGPVLCSQREGGHIHNRLARATKPNPK